jgi:hypothetical protein
LPEVYDNNADVDSFQFQEKEWPGEVTPATEDQLHQRDAASEVATLISIDDVPSLTSGSIPSSIGFTVELVEATEELMRLLMSDEVLKSLVITGLEKMSPERLERHCIRLLREFSQDLCEEATDAKKQVVVRVIRHRARIISQKLLSTLDPRRAERIDQMNDALQQDENIQGILEQYLREHEIGLSSYEKSGIGISDWHDKDNWAPDESDDSEAADEGLLKLNQLKEFILCSQAFMKLRHKLRLIISPNADLESPVPKTGEQPPAKNLFQSVHHQSNTEALLTLALRPIRFFLPKNAASVLNNMFLNMSRPRLREGYKRITCICVSQNLWTGGGGRWYANSGSKW